MALVFVFQHTWIVGPALSIVYRLTIRKLMKLCGIAIADHPPWPIKLRFWYACVEWWGYHWPHIPWWYTTSDDIRCPQTHTIGATGVDACYYEVTVPPNDNPRLDLQLYEFGWLIMLYAWELSVRFMCVRCCVHSQYVGVVNVLVRGDTHFQCIWYRAMYSH